MIYIANLNDKFIDSLLYLNEYYGVTRNPSTKDFIIIMKYYKSDLRTYITENFYNIEWNKKLKILSHVSAGLAHIHEQKNKRLFIEIYIVEIFFVKMMM